MNQLSELNIQDTKLNLVNLSNIFESCKNISHLAITVVEETLDDISLDFKVLNQGFQKLVCLRLHAVNAVYYIDSWLIILKFLRHSICTFINIINGNLFNFTIILIIMQLVQKLCRTID